MVLKKLIGVKGSKSLAATIKGDAPVPLEYVDDFVVVCIILGYAYGKLTGIELFPDWALVAVISYALGKDLNITD